MAHTYSPILTKGTEATLVNFVEGKLRFTTDTGRIFLDTGSNSRIEYTDFVKGLTEAEIKDLDTGILPKLYMSSDTFKLFYYDTENTEWKTITSDRSGHIIEDADETALTQRDTLRFGGYLNAADNSEDEVSLISDAPTEITWDNYNNLTAAQKEGTKWLITNVPSAITDEVIFVLRNRNLTFSNLTATISDPRINAYTYPLVYWSDASKQEAKDCKIISNTSSGSITFTAEEAPTNTLVCDIVFVSDATGSSGGTGPFPFEPVSTEANQGLSEQQKTNARDNIGLGTSAVVDVPVSGDAASTEVVMGNDSRLTDSRNAADVYSWAKAETKPTYTASEVGLGNVGNFKAVSTEASQGLTETEQANARANIGAGTSSLTIGNTSTTAAAGDHTHETSMATSASTAEITLAADTTYELTAGGDTYLFKTPADTNTHRPIKVDGTQILGDNTTALDLIGGDNITITNTDGAVTISAGGAGHDIQDKDDTTLTKRSNLKFGGYLNTTDDSTNDASVVSDAPTEITWDEYNALTTAQKEGTKWLVTNVPGNIDPEAIFILRNQVLTFSNLTATVSDARINANTYPLVYWANASYDEAESCKIVSNTATGSITFTAETAPESSLICDIVFISAATSSGGGGGSTGVKHILTLPTTGYTEETVTIWGEEKTVQSITLTQDKDGYSLSGFVADMIADYPINISGTMTDFKKVYAVEIGNLNVTFYLTDVPTAAFNVLIKEA